ncbi:MAG: hypothetical protein AAB225_17940 [Acidobacteriota bacterium]
MSTQPRGLPVLAVLSALPLWPQPLGVRLEANQLRVSAPQLGVLSGLPLERLRNGAPVPFAFKLTLSTDRHATTLLRDLKRFVFSYDLWEEKFSVVKLGHPRRSASHMATTAAEAWCVDDMALATAGLAQDRPFWARLEVRLENLREEAAEEESGVSLTRLIELFGRRAETRRSSWLFEAGPLRLADLNNSPARAPGPR